MPAVSSIGRHPRAAAACRSACSSRRRVCMSAFSWMSARFSFGIYEDALLESTLSAIASMAVFLHSEGSPVSLLANTGPPLVVQPGASVPHLQHVLESLARLTLAPGPSLVPWAMSELPAAIRWSWRPRTLRRIWTGLSRSCNARGFTCCPSWRQTNLGSYAAVRWRSRLTATSPLDSKVADEYPRRRPAHVVGIAGHGSRPGAAADLTAIAG